MTSTPVTPQLKEQELSEKVEKLAAWLDFQLGEPVGNQVRAIGAAVRERDDQIAQLRAENEQWSEWSNTLASMLPESYDGDAAQEALIERWIADAQRGVASLAVDLELARRELQQAQQRIAAVEALCSNTDMRSSDYLSPAARGAVLAALGTPKETK